MRHLTQIENFVRVVTEGSFAAAARAIKVTQPSASKAIADLERRLHHRLLHRTTRLVKPTESVQAYYRRMKVLTNLVDEANSEPNFTSNRGKQRVNTSAMLAQRLVMLAIMGFHYDHPQVEIEVTMDD
ncbi:MAG: LysR family transcriptional regulator, partial [Candidatus Saccharibacteria bacterium]|nr:LysR family transcriptional regulator [Pseudorhodobacter sp.]